MSTSSPSQESQLNTLNPQLWHQVERGDSLHKIPEPLVLPFFKPADYVEVLAHIDGKLESCPRQEISSLYFLQFQVFKGLDEVKLRRRSLRFAWQNANNVREKLVLGAWLKYEKQGEELIADLLASCGKCAQEFGPIDIGSRLHIQANSGSPSTLSNDNPKLNNVDFRIGNEKICCDRQKIAGLSAPFQAMLNGPFLESFCEEIDLSDNNISSFAFRAVREFSVTGNLDEVPAEVLLEILSFANNFCCERLKDTCERKLSTLVSSREDAVELMEYALQENSPILAASCLQVLLHELPDCLNDDRVVEIFSNANKQDRTIMVGPATFSLYFLLSEAAMSLDPQSNMTACFLEQFLESAEASWQKMLAFHQLGCVRLLRKEYDEAERLFEAAFNEGHIYSVCGLARVGYIKGRKLWAYNKLSSVISSSSPLGWMYMERSLYCEDSERWEDLQKATELDPTLTYPYMYRAASLMRQQNVQAALAEINRVLGFKLALECLELRFCFYLALEDYQAAICDVQTILTLSPNYRMFEGRVAASQLRTLVREHVENWTSADCWLQLYDRWSYVDDIGSLSVIYQMLESDIAKGVLYFRQSLLLLRLNCPEAAMRSLQLARQNASFEHERLVYEGWILYDMGHREEGLRKAEESIKIERSFEAFFLKAYALAESSLEPSCSSVVVSLLKDALQCPSDRLRKGQAFNNLASVYADCGKLGSAKDCYNNALKIRHTRAHQGLARVYSLNNLASFPVDYLKLDSAEDCYNNALKIRNTRAHQGLARVYFLKNDKGAAYAEMTKFIEKARNNASAYEKRSEYGDRDLTKADLEMVTKLDPLRVYPYTYRATVLVDNHKEKEAIAELSRAIAFKADLHLLRSRAAFHERIGEVAAARRDRRVAFLFDPIHEEMPELLSRVNSHER